MNKADLAQALAEKLNISKREAEDMLNAFVELVTATLKKGDDVVLTGFGAFSAKMRAARVGVNPQNPTQKTLYVRSNTQSVRRLPVSPTIF